MLTVCGQIQIPFIYITFSKEGHKNTEQNSSAGMYRTDKQQQKKETK